MNENYVESAAEICVQSCRGGGGGGGGGGGEEDIILDTSCNRLVECSVGGGMVLCSLYDVFVYRVLVLMG